MIHPEGKPNLSVLIRHENQTIRRVVKQEDLAQFVHTVTRLFWSVIECEWTDEEPTHEESER